MRSESVSHSFFIRWGRIASGPTRPAWTDRIPQAGGQTAKVNNMWGRGAGRVCYQIPKLGYLPYPTQTAVVVASLGFHNSYRRTEANNT